MATAGSATVEGIQRAVAKAKRFSARAQPSTIATALEEVLRECRIVMRGEPLTTEDVEALFGTGKVDEAIIDELRKRDQTLPRLLHAGLAVLDCFVNIQIQDKTLPRRAERVLAAAVRAMSNAPKDEHVQVVGCKLLVTVLLAFKNDWATIPEQRLSQTLCNVANNASNAFPSHLGLQRNCAVIIALFLWPSSARPAAPGGPAEVAEAAPDVLSPAGMAAEEAYLKSDAAAPTNVAVNLLKNERATSDDWDPAIRMLYERRKFGKRTRRGPPEIRSLDGAELTTHHCMPPREATADWTTDLRSITAIELLAGIARVSTMFVVKGIGMVIDLPFNLKNEILRSPARLAERLPTAVSTGGAAFAAPAMRLLAALVPAMTNGAESKALALLRPPTSLHLVALGAVARLPELADVAQAALRLLDAFSNMVSTAAVIAASSPEPAHVVAMRILTAFGDDGDVCFAALGLMKRLLDYGPADVKPTLLAMNVHTETMACAKKHLNDNDDVVSEAFGLLSFFAVEDANHEILGFPSDAMTMAMDVFLRYTKEGNVLGLTGCMMMLGALARYAEHSRELGHSQYKLEHAVCATMEAFDYQGCEYLQSYGCRLLAGLALDERCLARMMAKDCRPLNVIMDAFDRFPIEAVYVNSIDALYQMSQSPKADRFGIWDTGVTISRHARAKFPHSHNITAVTTFFLS